MEKYIQLKCSDRVASSDYAAVGELCLWAVALACRLCIHNAVIRVYCGHEGVVDMHMIIFRTHFVLFLLNEEREFRLDLSTCKY